MHTLDLLNVSKFRVEIDGRETDCGALVSGWHRHDRFGIVVQESFGAVGASLLIQAVIAEFFRSREAAGLRAIYPEIYAFHVGRDHGDLSAYDFWPAYKEVVVESDPVKVLHALNSHGITRLAVPDGPARDTQYIWPEKLAAEDRLATVLAYTPEGRTPNADVEIRSLSPDVESNTQATFDLTAVAQSIVFGDTEPTDDERRFAGLVWARQFAVPAADLEEARRRQEKTVTEGLTTETYRRADVAFALSHLVP